MKVAIILEETMFAVAEIEKVSDEYKVTCIISEYFVDTEDAKDSLMHRIFHMPEWNRTDEVEVMTNVLYWTPFGQKLIRPAKAESVSRIRRMFKDSSIMSVSPYHDTTKEGESWVIDVNYKGNKTERHYFLDSEDPEFIEWRRHPRSHRLLDCDFTK